ncbi:MAG: hypothetical protein B7Z13_06635, partial [Caulobacterales bacterium 32-67-6]
MAQATVPDQMTAIAIKDDKGPASALYPVTLPTPTPAPGQILIRVEAAGVNRPDIAQRAGFYPPPPGAPQTMGLEVAGEVVHGAGRWKTGGRIVFIAAQAGGKVELNIGALMMKRAVVTGSTLRPRPADEKARLA